MNLPCHACLVKPAMMVNQLSLSLSASLLSAYQPKKKNGLRSLRNEAGMLTKVIGSDRRRIRRSRSLSTYWRYRLTSAAEKWNSKITCIIGIRVARFALLWHRCRQSRVMKTIIGQVCVAPWMCHCDRDERVHRIESLHIDEKIELGDRQKCIPRMIGRENVRRQRSWWHEHIEWRQRGLKWQ